MNLKQCNKRYKLFSYCSEWEFLKSTKIAYSSYFKMIYLCEISKETDSVS